MKKLLLVLWLPLVLGCKKDEVTVKEGFLRQIVVQDKVHQSFEYYSGLLAKEQYFGFTCQDTPVDAFEYKYQNNRLVTLKSTLRGLYSSTSAMCDPATGLTSEEQFAYDPQGRLVRVNRGNSYLLFDYNAEGRVERQTRFSSDGTADHTSSFRYDARGNMVEETDASGRTTTYTYDQNSNPFFLMKQRPGWISPFNISPNNVIRANGQAQWERTFSYHPNGLPETVLETNGLIYKYIY
jgi:YD repeat-containing protein